MLGGPSIAHEPPAPIGARTVEALRRLAAVVPVVLRAIRRLALVSAGAVALAWLASLVAATPDEATAWVTRVVILVVALAPAGVLLLFAAGIDGLRELPSRYRELPADVRTNLRDLRPPPGARRRGAVRSVFALATTVFAARDVLSPVAIVTAALRPALLLATLAAAVVATLEIPVAAIVVIVLAA